MKKTTIIAILVVIVVLVLLIIYTQMTPPVSGIEQACINSGGTVGTSQCCLSASNFPNTCLIGACGCGPGNTHEVKVCNCPEGKCFDGNQCIPTVSEIQELALNEQDLQQLGMTQVWNETECQTQEQTSFSSSPVQYKICNYTINNLNDTSVIIELKKFTNLEDLNGTYLYESWHLYSVQGVISENDYGDQSLFRVNNVNDYMGHLNEPGVYYYHLWICKNLYLIHITSGGTEESAKEYIPKIGLQILSKFE